MMGSTLERVPAPPLTHTHLRMTSSALPFSFHPRPPIGACGTSRADRRASQHGPVATSIASLMSSGLISGPPTPPPFLFHLAGGAISLPQPISTHPIPSHALPSR
eukprot:GGOE01020437.1.p1 GENE.GGOE01020437.1~~GGOE01020437.1.p1  ORF type:complete len:105 (+),score=14.55 GGOE01020437.1:333-647(+)